MIQNSTELDKLIDEKVKYIEKVLDEVNVDTSDLKIFDEEMDLVINGGAFKGYMAGGIGLVLQKYGLLKNINSIYGVSAGSQIAIWYIVKNNLKHSLKSYYNLRLYTKLPNKIDLFDINNSFLQDDIHEIANKKKISFVATKIRWFSFQKSLLTNFNSKDHLIQCLKASCSLPLLFNSKWPFCQKIDNDYYIDGAFSDINGLDHYSNRNQLFINLGNIQYPLYKALNPLGVDDNLEESIIEGIKIGEKFINQKNYYCYTNPICIVKPNVFSKYYIFSTIYFLYRNFVSEIKIYYKFFKRVFYRIIFKYK